MNPSVVVSSVSKVQPSRQTPQPCYFQVSNFGLIYGPSILSQSIFYYKTDNASNAPTLSFSTFKDSLSQSLTHYYVLAGRFELPGENGKINCNDEGVVFIEASTDARFEDWSGMRECTIEDLLTGYIIEEDSPPPPLQIQVTKFACGGFSIGLTSPEMIMDGYSLGNFLNSWSEIHRGLAISTPPLIHGELLSARNPPRLECDESLVEKNYVIERNNYTIPEEQQAVTLLVKCLITGEQLQDLIQEVQNGSFGFGRPTSFEALSALVWMLITDARELDDEQITKFTYSINCRRFAPRIIPSNYFGNAAHASCLSANAGDVKSKHLSFAAKLIHEDIISQTLEVMMSSVDWMEMKRVNEGLTVGFNADYFAGTDVDCASLLNFPLYDVEFGYGKPLQFTMMVYHPSDGVTYMLPVRDGGRSKRSTLPFQQSICKSYLGILYSCVLPSLSV